ncbi:hypothetical protein, partial [Paenibacillus typhae]
MSISIICWTITYFSNSRVGRSGSLVGFFPLFVPSAGWI